MLPSLSLLPETYPKIKQIHFIHKKTPTIPSLKSAYYEFLRPIVRTAVGPEMKTASAIEGLPRSTSGPVSGVVLIPAQKMKYYIFWIIVLRIEWLDK